VLATEIADDLEAALEQFTKIAARLGKGADRGEAKAFEDERGSLPTPSTRWSNR
jgi:hypothetical protein